MRQRGTYVLNKGTLVLEGVTLGGVVQFVVEVLVDLARGTVLDQQAAENPLTAHPKNLPKFIEVNFGSWSGFPSTMASSCHGFSTFSRDAKSSHG